MAVQYRRSAQPGGYRPRRVDQGNIQRMREDTNRTVQGMRQRAEMEIADRRRNIAQQKEDQAATRRMEEKNFQIQSQNDRNELRGLQLKAEQESRQAAINAKATEDILGSIANLSKTASNFFLEKEKIDQQNEYNNQVSDSTRDDSLTEQYRLKLSAGIQSNEQLGAVQDFEAAGGSPLVAAKVKSRNPEFQALVGIGYAQGWVSRGGYSDLIFQRRQEIREAIGRDLDYEATKDLVQEVRGVVNESLNQQGYSPSMLGTLTKSLDAIDSQLLSASQREEIKNDNNQRYSQSLSLIENSVPEELALNFNTAFPQILDYFDGDRRAALNAVKPILTAIDPDTGNEIFAQSDIENIPIDTEEDGATTFGQKFRNANGQAVGILREIIQDKNLARTNFENQQEKAQEAANKDLEDELIRAFFTKPTQQNGRDLLSMYSEVTGGESSTRLQNVIKVNAIEVEQRENEFMRIAAKPDRELTQEDVDIAKLLNPTEGKTVEARYENGPGKFRTREAESQIKTGLAAIKGTTDVTQVGNAGSLQAQLYFRAQVYKKAELIYGDGNQGYTEMEAVAEAVARETEIYNSEFQVPGTRYYRKLGPNETISYPWIDARAGNVTAAEKAIRDYNALKSTIKSIGFNAVANVPNSFMTAERMEYVAQNPTAEPDALESAMLRMSPGIALHELRNKAFAAAGRPERFSGPAVLSGIDVDTETQRIVNDARRSYQAKLNAINVASGNTGVYQAPTYMRRGFSLRQAATSNSISSVLDQLTDADWDELGYVVSGEAARNTDDEYGVAASVLTRLISGKYGNTIGEIIRRPNQYEAVTLGTARYEPELSEKLKSPEGREKIKRFFEILDGRTDFKGQSQLKNRVVDEDPMFSPRGNFYHYSYQ